ncbi:MAG: tyrosine-type recombinase/integrase [Pseudomonadota bacterium]
MIDIPLVLKFDDWPSSDQALWSSLFEEADIFDDTGQLSHWRSGSQQMLRQGYGQWLSFLMRKHPEVVEESPLARVRPDLIDEYVAECETRLKPVTVQTLVSDICNLVPAAAPPDDWAWLHRIAKRLAKKVDRGSLPKRSPLTAGQIFNWSLRRIDEVRNDPTLSEKKRAIHFRDALIIGFLIARPVRKRALLAMDVDQHLVLRGQGFSLHYSKEDMKDGRSREYPFPAKLTAPMLEYLEVHRPVLLGENEEVGLWVNQYGTRFAYDGFTRSFGKLTEVNLGYHLRPQAFRHIAATSIAEFDPAHVGIIRDILGHATLDMAEKHYNRASQVSACNALQALHEAYLE